MKTHGKKVNKIPKYRATISDVGKSIAVGLRSLGDGRQLPTKDVDKRIITDVYPDAGSVRDNAGEVWFIRPYTKYGTDFVAVK